MFFKKYVTILQTSKKIKFTLSKYNIKKKHALKIPKHSVYFLNNYFIEILYQTKKHIYLSVKKKYSNIN